MMQRNDYLLIIEEIRNIEKISINEYIEKRLIPLSVENSFFVETLYKDILYLLKDIEEEGDNDLVIENGDFLIEDGDFKINGYQTRLDEILTWLHMQVVRRLMLETNSPIQFSEKLENFEKNFLYKANYTAEYKNKLDKIHQSLRKERVQNSSKKKSIIKKIFDPDNLELKPNIMGVGININEIINKFRKQDT